jgi:hypothetical protein
MGIADERHDLTVDLGLDVEAATPLGAVIEDQVEHDERAGELRRGPALQANMAPPAESTALVLENDPGVSRHPPDARPGRNGLRLHLEDVGEVRIQLHDERRADGVIRERSDQEVVVHDAGDPASDVEQQGPLGDAARACVRQRRLDRREDVCGTPYSGNSRYSSSHVVDVAEIVAEWEWPDMTQDEVFIQHEVLMWLVSEGVSDYWSHVTEENRRHHPGSEEDYLRSLVQRMQSPA